MNIFEQYGIKEVADVCLYSIELDENDDEIYVPVLYLDTLKVSTFSQTAEQVSARGGLGNPHLIVWDFGKEIKIDLEDALFSPASQSIAWGGKLSTKKFELIGTFIANGEELEEKVTKVKVLNFSEVVSNQNSWVWRCNIAISTLDNSIKMVKVVNLCCDKDTDLGVYQWHFDNGSNTIEFDEGVLAINTIQNTISPQEFMYIIDHSIQNVKVLDRLEKCKATHTFAIDTKINITHNQYSHLEKYSKCELTVFIDPKTMQPYEPNAKRFKRQNGEVINGDLRIIKQHEVYYKWTRQCAPEYTTLGQQIIVDPIHFPGTYKLVGETYVRNRNTGKDQRYQLEIPLCKMSSNNNITLQADGDPTTFNFSLQVLRKEDNTMIKLTQYDVAAWNYDGIDSGSTEVIPQSAIVENIVSENSNVKITWRTDFYGEPTVELTPGRIDIESPDDGTVYLLTDELTKTNGEPQGEYNIAVALYYNATITGRKGTRKYIDETPTNIWKKDEDGNIILSEIVTETIEDYSKTYLDPDEYNVEITDGGV